jgi:hypothetical protein
MRWYLQARLGEGIGTANHQLKCKGFMGVVFAGPPSGLCLLAQRSHHALCEANWVQACAYVRDVVCTAWNSSQGP